MSGGRYTLGNKFVELQKESQRIKEKKQAQHDEAERQRKYREQKDLEAAVVSNDIVKKRQQELQGKAHPYGDGGNFAATGGYEQPKVGPLKPSKHEGKKAETPIVKPIAATPIKVKAKPVVKKSDNTFPIVSVVAPKPAKKSEIQKDLDRDFILLQEKSDRKFAKQLQAQINHDQEREDYELALSLQAEENEREKAYLDPDHVLAAKLQIQEEVKKDVEIPTIKKLNKEFNKNIKDKQKEDILGNETTLGYAAQDVYERGLANLKNKKQLVPAPAPKAKADKEMQNSENYLGNFAIIILIETRIELAVAAGKYVIHQMQCAVLNLNLFANEKDGFSLNLQFSQSYLNLHGLFAEPKSGYQLANNKANRGPVVTEIKDDETMEMTTFKKK